MPRAAVLARSAPGNGAARPQRPTGQVRRDWCEVHAAHGEAPCRVGLAIPWGDPDFGCAGPLQYAHTIGRSHDEPHPERGEGWRLVRALDVVRLCRKHHQLYDGRALDLLPYLTIPEQARAVHLAGGIVSALLRLTSGLTTDERRYR
jgi:hypothetical protein